MHVALAHRTWDTKTSGDYNDFVSPLPQSLCHGRTSDLVAPQPMWRVAFRQNKDAQLGAGA
jgi:hypothetical protein